jgi:hypothetical protein
LTELLITVIDLFLCIFIFRLVLIQIGFILTVLLGKSGEALLLLLDRSGNFVGNCFETPFLIV